MSAVTLKTNCSASTTKHQILFLGRPADKITDHHETETKKFIVTLGRNCFALNRSQAKKIKYINSHRDTWWHHGWIMTPIRTLSLGEFWSGSWSKRTGSKAFFHLYHRKVLWQIQIQSIHKVSIKSYTITAIENSYLRHE